MTDPYANERAHYQQWLAANPTTEGRERIQAALDRLPPASGTGTGSGSGSGTSTQAPQGEDEAAVARQILAAAHLTRVSPA